MSPWHSVVILLSDPVTSYLSTDSGQTGILYTLCQNMGTIAVARDRQTENIFTKPCHCSAERDVGPWVGPRLQGPHQQQDQAGTDHGYPVLEGHCG